MEEESPARGTKFEIQKSNESCSSKSQADELKMDGAPSGRGSPFRFRSSPKKSNESCSSKSVGAVYDRTFFVDSANSKSKADELKMDGVPSGRGSPFSDFEIHQEIERILQLKVES